MTESNLFQEVQEDLERQKIEALWKRYGNWLIAVALAVVLGTAVTSAYRSWRVEREQKLTSGFLDASRADKDPVKNLDALRQFADANMHTDASVFALLRAGGIAAEQGDKAKAAALFDAASQDDKADDTFRQLGTLLSVQSQMDDGDAAALSTRLDPLTAERAPWRFAALEMQGYLALRAQNAARAKRIFTDLSQDARAPQGISARAADILRAID